MKTFEYHRPSSVEEACQILSGSGRSRPLAGGTDLVVRMKAKALALDVLVSLRDLPELSFIKYDNKDGLAVGSMTSLTKIEEAPEVVNNYPALAEAVASIGSVQVRNRSTVGGNICNAAPSADTVPILIAYGAQAVITDGKSESEVPLEDFFTGPGQTVLEKNQILRALKLPPPPAESFGIYLKASRASMDCAVVGMGLVAVFEKGGDKIKDLRAVLGAVAPTPVRSFNMEKTVKGNPLSDELIAQAAQAALSDASPISDVRSSEAYRKDLIFAYAKQALAAAVAWRQKGE